MSGIFYREKHRDWELVLPRIVQKLGKKTKKTKQEDESEETDSLKQKIVKNNVEESDEELEEGSDSDEEFNSKTEKEKIEEEIEQSSGSDENLEQDSDSDDESIPKQEQGVVEMRENEVKQLSDSEEKLESGSDKSERESDEEYDDGTDEDSDDDNSNEDSDDALNSDENSFAASLKEALGKTDKRSSISKSPQVDGESVVKMLDLKSQDAKIVLMQTQQKADNSQHKIREQKRSSFFLGGESESDNEEVEQSAEGSSDDGEDVYQRNGGVENKNFRPAFDKSKKRESDSHNHKRDKNFGGKRKQFQKVTSVKKPKFNKGSDRPSSAQAVDRTRNKYVVKNNTEIKVKQNDPNKTVNVHPSWEAKQKQKPSIQTFQGKKTVFE